LKIILFEEGENSERGLRPLSLRTPLLVESEYRIGKFDNYIKAIKRDGSSSRHKQCPDPSAHDWILLRLKDWNDR
jgi:hypothetical protein